MRSHKRFVKTTLSSFAGSVMASKANIPFEVEVTKVYSICDRNFKFV